MMPQIGDSILIAGADRTTVTETIDYISDDVGQFHFKDVKGNDYYKVGVFTEHNQKAVMYEVRWDEMLQEWVEVGLTLDYEED